MAEEQDVQNSEAALRELVMTLGMGFHPDNPVSDYVRTADGEPTFVGQDRERLQAGLDLAWATLGEERIYEFVRTLEPWKSYLDAVDESDVN